MFNEDKIRNVRNNFVLVSKEFDFEFHSPFVLTDKLEAFGYIENYGSKNGVVICLISPHDFQINNKIVEWCKLDDCFCSCLNIELITGKYNRVYFREMLRDWGKY